MNNDIFKIIDKVLREIEEREPKAKSNDLEEFWKELKEELKK